MPLQFENKVALVTGAAGGIGEATARHLARAGARVLVVDIDEAGAHRVAQTIHQEGFEARAFRADVASAEQCQAMVAEALGHYGSLHLAVNNAGIAGAYGRLADVSVDQWRKVMGVNLDSVFFGMKYQLPAIEAAGGGAVVNVSSVYGHLGLRCMDAYTASKHAVIGITRSAAIDFATRGVRINAVCPGVVATPLTHAGGTAAEKMAALAPMKRIGRPEEQAKAIAFLLSDDASFIMGVNLVVDGGFSLS